MADCRAALITGFNQPLEIQSVRIPDLQPTGMLARVEAATLCGTDVHRWHGAIASPEQLPFIPGHETCGTIAQMNGDRWDMLGTPLKPGDRVLWSYPTCGHCYWCVVARQPTLCPEIRVWGGSRADVYPYLLGGMAEYQYIPPGCDIIRVPDAVSSPSAAAAACAYRTVMHGFERLGAIAPHETVVVQGSGPLGLFAAVVARERGAYRVFVIGAPEGRLQAARELGVDDVLNLDEVGDAAERRQWVLDRTADRGADIVIQCATHQAVPEGLAMTRKGGRYLSVGVGGDASISPTDFWRMVNIVPVTMAEPRNWLQAVRFIESRPDIPFDRMISRAYTLEQVTEAMQAMANFEVVKPVIYPNGM